MFFRAPGVIRIYYHHNQLQPPLSAKFPTAMASSAVPVEHLIVIQISSSGARLFLQQHAGAQTTVFNNGSLSSNEQTAGSTGFIKLNCFTQPDVHSPAQQHNSIHLPNCIQPPKIPNRRDSVSKPALATFECRLCSHISVRRRGRHSIRLPPFSQVAAAHFPCAATLLPASIAGIRNSSAQNPCHLRQNFHRH